MFVKAEKVLATDHARNASRLVTVVKSLRSLHVLIAQEDDFLAN